MQIGDNWSLSSSSEDEDDGGAYRSRFRADSDYHRKFLIGDYGTDDWSDHLPQFTNLRVNSENHSSIGNVSMSNGTLANGLHVPCSVAERIMVLNRDTNQYEVMRYVEVSNGSIITANAMTHNSHNNNSTMNDTMATSSVAGSSNSFIHHLTSPRRALQANGNMKTLSKIKSYQPPLIIPMERIDFISIPKDPRKAKPEPDELMDFILPSLVDRIEWNGKEWVSAKKPKPKPKTDQNQGFKPSLSYDRERRNRVKFPKQKNDPRLQGLFDSPKRVEGQSSRDGKICSAVGIESTMEQCFGFDSNPSVSSGSCSPSMSPAFATIDSESDFARERNSTALRVNSFESGSTESDIGMHSSDSFEDKIERRDKNERKDKKERSRGRKHKTGKTGGKENDKVPPLRINLKKLKSKNPIDEGHSSETHLKPNSNVMELGLQTPESLQELKNDVIAAIQGEFPDDEDLTNENENETTEKIEETDVTKATHNDNQTDKAAAETIENMKILIDDEAADATNASTNEQPKENDTTIKATNADLDEVSDTELVDEAPAMVSHGNLTDLEDVSMEESEGKLDDISLEDDVLAEALQAAEGFDMLSEIAPSNDNVERQPNDTGNSEILEEIEKDLAALDDDDALTEEQIENDIDKFFEPIGEQNDAEPNSNDPQNHQVLSHNDLLKILDTSFSEENSVNAVGSTVNCTENVPAAQPAELNVPLPHVVCSFDVPEIGATADIGVAANTSNKSDQINLDGFMECLSNDLKTECKDSLKASNDLNSFGRLKNWFAIDETQRVTINLEMCPRAEQLAIEEYIEMEPASDAHQMQSDSHLVETSDDDQGEDFPIESEQFTLPNSNTDSRVTQMNLQCTICPYKNQVGWKHLTKHYIRKHPGAEIAHSRLAKRLKVDEIVENPVSSTVTESSNVMLIKSICLFCDQYYCLDSTKWTKHFISHTGEYPFECHECGSKLFDDLHKRCNSKHNKVINGPHEFKGCKLYGYVCKLCNFVQLDKKNICQHIENQHHQVLNDETEKSIVEILLINKKTEPEYIFEELTVDDDDDEDEHDKDKIQLTKYAKSMKKPDSEGSMDFDCVDLTLSDDDIE